ncbi:CcdB family protein [Ruegeria lacuscaerulensis]|uniref:CcdB family protein n=1 Tax=Ruegeria lacuscaerulensis TaxID=55218 RepID=UPI001481BE4B|nr:CcdB family protein [Ruegeria lacuscaerulensis]
MPKYDVFPNPSGDGFLLDVQTDLLSDLNTRIVVPLLPNSTAPIPAARLNPVFEVNGERVVMVTQFLAAVPVGILKSQICNLSDEFDQITVAIDMLMQGF